MVRSKAHEHPAVEATREEDLRSAPVGADPVLVGIATRPNRFRVDQAPALVRLRGPMSRRRRHPSSTSSGAPSELERLRVGQATGSLPHHSSPTPQTPGIWK